MDTITNMGMAEKRTLKSALKEALADVADQFGLEFELSKEKSDSGSFETSLRMKVTLDDDGNVIDKDKEVFERRAMSLDVPPEWYNAVCREGRTEYRVVGLNPSRPKNCVSIKRVHDGKGMICPPGWVRRHLRAL